MAASNSSLTPWYWDDGHRPLDAAQVWISKGGAIAVANIRGGGEFGPAWHQAALKEHRQRAFDDFAAVAQATWSGANSRRRASLASSAPPTAACLPP